MFPGFTLTSCASMCSIEFNVVLRWRPGRGGILLGAAESTAAAGLASAVSPRSSRPGWAQPRLRALTRGQLPAAGGRGGGDPVAMAPAGDFARGVPARCARILRRMRSTTRSGRPPPRWSPRCTFTTRGRRPQIVGAGRATSTRSSTPSTAPRSRAMRRSLPRRFKRSSGVKVVFHGGRPRRLRWGLWRLGQELARDRSDRIPRRGGSEYVWDHLFHHPAAGGARRPQHSRCAC